MQSFGTGQSSIVNAGLWLQHLLLGSLATTIAVLAIAATGAAMLAGTVDLRRAARVILGCFVLLGAPVIATGLRDMLGGATGQVVEIGPLQVPKASSAPLSVDPFDPYAGVAVPQQR